MELPSRRFVRAQVAARTRLSGLWRREFDLTTLQAEGETIRQARTKAMPFLMSGERPRAMAYLTTDFRKHPGRQHYVRCVLTCGPDGVNRITPTGTQSSGVLRSMALANALAIVEAEVERVPAGTALPVLLLDFPETATIPAI